MGLGVAVAVRGGGACCVEAVEAPPAVMGTVFVIAVVTRATARRVVMPFNEIGPRDPRLPPDRPAAGARVIAGCARAVPKGARGERGWASATPIPSVSGVVAEQISAMKSSVTRTRWPVTERGIGYNPFLLHNWRPSISPYHGDISVTTEAETASMTSWQRHDPTPPRTPRDMGKPLLNAAAHTRGHGSAYRAANSFCANT